MENVQNFLQLHYSDQKLAELLTLIESGRLSYNSCCCLVGFATAAHAFTNAGGCCDPSHLREARELPYGRDAEREFYSWGDDREDDGQRRMKLLPLVIQEIERRKEGRKLTQELEARQGVDEFVERAIDEIVAA